MGPEGGAEFDGKCPAGNRTHTSSNIQSHRCAVSATGCMSPSNAAHYWMSVGRFPVRFGTKIIAVGPNTERILKTEAVDGWWRWLQPGTLRTCTLYNSDRFRRRLCSVTLTAGQLASTFKLQLRCPLYRAHAWVAGRQCRGAANTTVHSLHSVADTTVGPDATLSRVHGGEWRRVTCATQTNHFNSRMFELCACSTWAVAVAVALAVLAIRFFTSDCDLVWCCTTTETQSRCCSTLSPYSRAVCCVARTRVDSVVLLTPSERQMLQKHRRLDCRRVIRQ